MKLDTLPKDNREVRVPGVFSTFGGMNEPGEQSSRFTELANRVV